MPLPKRDQDGSDRPVSRVVPVQDATRSSLHVYAGADMSDFYEFHITGINPEPWVAPESAPGRKNGKMFVQVFQSDTVKSFKAAIKEEFVQQNGWWTKPLDGHLIVEFFLWRVLDQSEAQDRRRRRNWADSTNCQKLLEDALQGILYDNDRGNRLVLTHMVEQTATTVPHVAIRIRPYALPFGEPLLGEPPALPTYSVKKSSNVINHEEEPF